MTLHELGLKYGTDKATWHGYCRFYEQHLPRTIGRLLEIGVKDGASLRMWADYYPTAEVVGIDILPVAPVPGCTVHRMDATNAAQLATLGQFDVIVDDGSHRTSDQLASFHQLFHHQLSPGGWYIMEDAHTSFMPAYVDTPEPTFHALHRLFPGKVLEWCRTADRTDSLTLMMQKPWA